jgi:hypothetical protein
MACIGDQNKMNEQAEYRYSFHNATTKKFLQSVAIKVVELANRQGIELSERSAGNVFSTGLMLLGSKYTPSLKHLPTFLCDLRTCGDPNDKINGETSINQTRTLQLRMLHRRSG